MWFVFASCFALDIASSLPTLASLRLVHLLEVRCSVFRETFVSRSFFHFSLTHLSLSFQTLYPTSFHSHPTTTSAPLAQAVSRQVSDACFQKLARISPSIVSEIERRISGVIAPARVWFVFDNSLLHSIWTVRE